MSAEKTRLGGTGWSAAVAAALLLSACSSSAGAGPEEIEVEARLEPAASFLCGEYEVTGETLANPVLASELDDSWFELMNGGQADLFTGILAHPEEWWVLEESEQELALFGPAPLAGSGSSADDRMLGFDHEVYSMVLRPDGSPAMPMKEGTNWDLGGATGCRLATDTALPAVSLDPAEPPAPGDAELHLLVIDHSCGGDTDMPGRIEVRRLEQTSEEIGLLIGVKPLPPGVHTCQGFPPTPYTLRLDAPIGERAILDLSRPASHWDMRAAIAPPAPLTDEEQRIVSARAEEIAEGIREVAGDEPGFLEVRLDEDYLVHLVMDRAMTDDLKVRLSQEIGGGFTVDYPESVTGDLRETPER